MDLLGNDPPEIKTVITSLETAAANGDINAMFQLGYLYDTGEYVPQNKKMAIKWYKKAAMENDRIAQNNLGLIYLNGEGVKTQPVKAAHYFTLAANQGQSDAQCSLGYMYINGIGVRKNIKKGMYWTRLAAVNGIPDAVENIGWIEQNYHLNPDGSIARASMHRRIIISILLVLCPVVSALVLVYNTIEEFMLGFSPGLSIYLFLTYLLSIVGIVQVFRWKKSGVNMSLIAAAMILMVSCLTWLSDSFFILLLMHLDDYSGATTTLMVIISLQLLLLFIPNKDRMSVFDLVSQDSKLNGFFREFGYGEKFLISSASTRRYMVYKNVMIGLLLILAAWESYEIITLSQFDFSLNENMFKSVLIWPLYIFGFFATLSLSADSYETHSVEVNQWGQPTKDLGREYDVIDDTMGGILWPLLQRFILFPLMAAAAVYYALYFILNLLSGIFPYILCIVLFAAWFGWSKWLSGAVFKLHRKILIPIYTVSFILLSLLFVLIAQ